MIYRRTSFAIRGKIAIRPHWINSIWIHLTHVSLNPLASRTQCTVREDQRRARECWSPSRRSHLVIHISPQTHCKGRRTSHTQEVFPIAPAMLARSLPSHKVHRPEPPAQSAWSRRVRMASVTLGLSPIFFIVAATIPFSGSGSAIGTVAKLRPSGE